MAQRRDPFKNDLGSKRFGHVTRWRREGAKKLRPNCAAVDWLGMIPPAHLAMKDKPLRYSRRLVGRRKSPKKPDPSFLKAASPVENEVRRFASGCQSRLQGAKRPSTASLERDAGLPSLRLTSLGLKRPSVLPSLGGCPASCPDTYRLTHDHRHVRNWAIPQIRVLTLLCKNFFRLRQNFPNRSLRRRAQRARVSENEQTLSFLTTPEHSRRAARGFCCRADLRAARKGLDALRCADERRHHEDAAGEQHGLEDVRAEVVETEQDRECPAAGKRRAEHFGADQDRRADDGDDAGPDDLAGAFRRGQCIHGSGSC